jgi:hypothetical protein
LAPTQGGLKLTKTRDLWVLPWSSIVSICQGVSNRVVVCARAASVLPRLHTWSVGVETTSTVSEQQDSVLCYRLQIKFWCAFLRTHCAS